MTRQVLLQPAYVLHQRAYRNTSALLEILTRDHGRVGAVARGVKGKGGESRRGLLQPFIPLLISYSGRQGYLHTLISVEPAGDLRSLAGQALFSAFYLNELLMGLLQRSDAHERLFHNYDDAIGRLKNQEECEPVLRRFEVSLLQELGYGMQLETDGDQQPIEADGRYYYDPLRGPVHSRTIKTPLPTVSGSCLHALARLDFSDRDCWPEMKLLMRNVIAHHMNGKPLRSRELFRME